MNNEENFINITSGETPDFGYKMTSEEKELLTAKVLEKIEIKQNAMGKDKTKVIKFQRKVISLIAAALVLVVSTTALATISNDSPILNKGSVKKATQETKAEKETKATKETEHKQVATEKKTIPTEQAVVSQKDYDYVYVLDGTSEDYIMIDKGEGWYSFRNEDNAVTFDCRVICKDIEESMDRVIEVGINNSQKIIPVYEKTMIEDKKAIYVVYSSDWMYGHQLFVKDKHSEYILNILAPLSISKEQLYEIGKQITLQPCNEEQGSEFVNFSTYLENYQPDLLKGEIPYKKAIDYTELTYINQTIENSDLQFEVQGINKVENIGDMITESQENSVNMQDQKGDLYSGGKFTGYLESNVNLFTNEDGTLAEYERSYVYSGDGINAPKQKIVYQKIQQEFYLIKVRIKNLSDKKLSAVNLLYPLNYISDDENFYSDTGAYSRPAGVNSCQIDNMPKYFSNGSETIDIEAGQDVFVELGYFVDKDLADNMLLNIHDYRVDVR